MISKIIHCCWVGGGEKDKLASKCRASWTKHAPDFKINEWDMSTIESSGVAMPPFVKAAMANKKWAFVADWVRFLALYLEGGVYFDYDFELLKPINDLLAQGEFVAGQWMPDGSIGMEPAIIALEKGSPIAKAMLDYYERAEFDGKTTVGVILAQLSPKLKVVDPEVFSPIDVRGVCHTTHQTLGIHHYAMSWATPKRRIAKWLAWHGMRKVVELLLKLNSARK